ncbi:MAG: LysR family transcriptional regulator [Polyangiaceae bacterium]|nr:LysR family transcriptional regulator [Polyangiaceae bacterium]
MPLVSARFVEVFCTVVEAASFTIAARQLGITPAAVSRAIAKLEQHLGVVLFRRTTRSMKLTEEGSAYFDQCREALSLLEVAERRITQKQTAPRGLVRISVPTTYGHYRVLPVVARFREAYPDVHFDLNVSNHNIDFVADGYDLAIRAGELEDSTLVVRRLEDASLGVYASPPYLARSGTPKTPTDLEKHTVIGFIRPSTGRTLSYLFRDRDGSRFEVPIKRCIRCSDDFLACITLARAGGGLVQAYRFIVEEDVARGSLVEVLKPYAGGSRPFSLLSPARRVPTLAVRMFADALITQARSWNATPPTRKGSTRGRVVS